MSDVSAALQKRVLETYSSEQKLQERNKNFLIG